MAEVPLVRVTDSDEKIKFFAQGGNFGKNALMVVLKRNNVQPVTRKRSIYFVPQIHKRFARIEKRTSDTKRFFRKAAIYAQCLLELVGKKPIPRYCEAHNDIVTCFDAGTADALIGFCRGVQAASPVDSYAAPEPSPEPGYTDEVIMASGSFTQGSTIELSCDGPLREPYTCYLQGGLNFAASRAGVLLAVQNAYFKD